MATNSYATSFYYIPQENKVAFKERLAKESNVGFFKRQFAKDYYNKLPLLKKELDVLAEEIIKLKQENKNKAVCNSKTREEIAKKYILKNEFNKISKYFFKNNKKKAVEEIERFLIGNLGLNVNLAYTFQMENGKIEEILKALYVPVNSITVKAMQKIREKKIDLFTTTIYPRYRSYNNFIRHLIDKKTINNYTQENINRVIKQLFDKDEKVCKEIKAREKRIEELKAKQQELGKAFNIIANWQYSVKNYSKELEILKNILAKYNF